MTSQNTTAVRWEVDDGTTGSGPPDPDPLHSPPGDPTEDAPNVLPGQAAAPDATPQEEEEGAGRGPSVLWSSACKQSEVLLEPPLSDDESVLKPLLVNTPTTVVSQTSRLACGLDTTLNHRLKMGLTNTRDRLRMSRREQ